jgi:hypothetical protein
MGKKPLTNGQARTMEALHEAMAAVDQGIPAHKVTDALAKAGFFGKSSKKK